MTAQAIWARMDPTGEQVVEIVVDHGYRPRLIVARSGVPLRLVFHRRDAETCSERVVFSSPHVDRRLAPHGETTIVLPPQLPGEVRFTCAMGRYHGRIELRAGVRPSLAMRLWTRVSRLSRSVGSGIAGSMALIVGRRNRA
jgi:plastocyanin domain-containing protein